MVDTLFNDCDSAVLSLTLMMEDLVKNNLDSPTRDIFPNFNIFSALHNFVFCLEDDDENKLWILDKLIINFPKDGGAYEDKFKILVNKKNSLDKDVDPRIFRAHEEQLYQHCLLMKSEVSVISLHKRILFTISLAYYYLDRMEYQKCLDIMDEMEIFVFSNENVPEGWRRAYGLVREDCDRYPYEDLL